MPEALARAPRGPFLSAPVREVPLRRVEKRSPPLLRRLLPHSVSGYAAAALAASLIGIVVNAVVLQRDRHPAPFFHGFASPPVAAPAPAPPPRAAEAPKPVAAEPAPAAPPPARPAPTVAPAARDPLGDFIRANTLQESARQVAAAQAALARLGYEIKADGVMRADSEMALHDFEKSHGLPLTSELTPHLIAKLAAAAR